MEKVKETTRKNSLKLLIATITTVLIFSVFFILYTPAKANAYYDERNIPNEEYIRASFSDGTLNIGTVNALSLSSLCGGIYTPDYNRIQINGLDIDINLVKKIHIGSFPFRINTINPHAIRIFPNVEEITIDAPCDGMLTLCDNAIANLPNLRVVNIHDPEYFSLTTSNPFIVSCPALQEVNIDFSNRSCDKSAAKIFQDGITKELCEYNNSSRDNEMLYQHPYSPYGYCRKGVTVNVAKHGQFYGKTESYYVTGEDRPIDDIKSIIVDNQGFPTEKVNEILLKYAKQDAMKIMKLVEDRISKKIDFISKKGLYPEFANAIDKVELARIEMIYDKLNIDKRRFENASSLDELIRGLFLIPPKQNIDPKLTSSIFNAVDVLANSYQDLLDRTKTVYGKFCLELNKVTKIRDIEKAFILEAAKGYSKFTELNVNGMLKNIDDNCETLSNAIAEKFIEHMSIDSEMAQIDNNCRCVNTKLIPVIVEKRDKTIKLILEKRNKTYDAEEGQRLYKLQLEIKDACDDLINSLKDKDAVDVVTAKLAHINELIATI